jgi:diphthamide synthase (EF-2-diphthine--ammonia ligase)
LPFIILFAPSTPGCRHCPYSHENVKDKTSRIQQPALLHEEWDQDVLFSLSKDKNKPIKVLFNSGGKDSFLTMRALARQCRQTSEQPFSLILLTTFDATSRIIAHQEFSIDTVVKQARHLRISLAGVPVHRATSETYIERIQRALNVIEKHTGQCPAALVFGDLHLETIRSWRDTMLGNAFPQLRLEYPLWKVDYETLLTDLESSAVVPLLSASTKDVIEVGTKFTREFVEKIKKEDIDAFGENGEFHSSAETWLVSREMALGLHP